MMGKTDSVVEPDDRAHPIPPATERGFVALVQWTSLAFAPVLAIVAWLNRDSRWQPLPSFPSARESSPGNSGSAIIRDPCRWCC